MSYFCHTHLYLELMSFVKSRSTMIFSWLGRIFLLLFFRQKLVRIQRLDTSQLGLRLGSRKQMFDGKLWRRVWFQPMRPTLETSFANPLFEFSFELSRWRLRSIRFQLRGWRFRPKKGKWGWYPIDGWRLWVVNQIGSYQKVSVSLELFLLNHAKINTKGWAG